MALLEVITRVDLPAYRQQVTLDGTDYILFLVFNERMNKWMLTITDVAEEPMIENVPVVANWPLIDRFRVAGQPPGSLIAYDTANTNTDPGRFDLGNRVRLLYEEATA